MATTATMKAMPATAMKAMKPTKKPAVKTTTKVTTKKPATAMKATKVMKRPAAAINAMKVMKRPAAMKVMKRPAAMKVMKRPSQRSSMKALRLTHDGTVSDAVSEADSDATTLLLPGWWLQHNDHDTSTDSDTPLDAFRPSHLMWFADFGGSTASSSHERRP